MYSFLMIGQSNMAGRGFIHEVPAIENERLYVLRNGRWYRMFVPVNFDRPFSGISLAESFADVVSTHYGVDVGLIPCADGGTRLNQWMPGEVLYDNALAQAKLAQRTSEIAGVLWHQGEADCAEDRYPLYYEKCSHILSSFRKDLGLHDVPFLVGGLGEFLPKCRENLKNYSYINEALQSMARDKEYIAYVPADGLTSNPDNLHFNAVSLREFGLRYFEVFRPMNTVITQAAAKVFDAKLTEMEQL